MLVIRNQRIECQTTFTTTVLLLSLCLCDRSEMGLLLVPLTIFSNIQGVPTN